MGKEYKVDIPYTATVRKVYYDGSESIGTISGTYKGVDVNEFTIVYGEVESLL